MIKPTYEGWETRRNLSPFVYFHFNWPTKSSIKESDGPTANGFQIYACSPGEQSKPTNDFFFFFSFNLLSYNYMEIMGLAFLAATSLSHYHTKLSLSSSWKNVSHTLSHSTFFILFSIFLLEKFRDRISLPPPIPLPSF